MAGSSSAAIAYFTVGGLAYAVGQQMLSYMGASSPSSLLYVIPMYAASLVMLFFPASGQSPPRVILRQIAPSTVGLASLDVLAVSTGTLGIVLAGSGVASVLQSSSVVITAVIAVFVVGARTKPMQWVAIAAVFAGLALSSVESSSRSPDTLAASTTPDTKMLGFAVSLLCATISSLEAIAIQQMASSAMKRGRPVLSSMDLCVSLGLLGLLYTLTYVLIYTVPRWDELISSKLSAPGWQVLVVFVLCTISCVFNNRGYFAMLHTLGAVTTGVFGAARAALLFLVSHLLFCSRDSSQCIGYTKTVAVTMILGGVLAFSSVAGSKTKTSSRPRTLSPVTEL